MFSLIVVGLLSVAAPADADPKLAPWFHSLQQPKTGGLCCGIADCRHYPVWIGDAHYWIMYNGKWMRVPDDAISPRTDNPTGDFVACVMADSWRNGVHTGPKITCFVLAPGT